MAEPDLGPLLRGASPNLPKLDVDTVVERSRSRRERRTVAARIVVALVVIGALGSGTYGLAHLGGGVGSSASSGISAPSAPVAGVACTGPAPATAQNAGGLTARVEFGTVRVKQPSALGTVTLTNSGSSPISGVAGEPTVTLAKDGTVVWRTITSDSAGILIHLKPGASMTIDAYLQSDGCAPAGRYEVTASMTVAVDDGTTLGVTSAPSGLVIRP